MTPKQGKSRFVHCRYVAILLLAGCGSATRLPRLQHLTLRPSDLPRGMKLESARWWSNTQAARRDGVAPSVYVSHGRQESYSVRFTRSLSGATVTYLQRVESEITAFRNPPGAAWAYTRARAAAEHSYMWGATTLGSDRGRARVRVPARQVTAPAVGASRAAFLATWGGDEFAYTTCTVVFQRRTFLARVEVTALEEDVARRWVARLARIVDMRLMRGS